MKNVHYKRIASVSLIFVSIALLVALGYYIFAVSFKLSDKDFVAVEQKMDMFFAGMKVTDSSKTKHCNYYTDSMSRTLKCAVDITGYVPLENQSDLSAIKTEVGTRLQAMGGTPEMWQQTINKNSTAANGSFSVSDGPLSMACRVNLIPDSNRAIVKLSCGGASRKAYFAT